MMSKQQAEESLLSVQNLTKVFTSGIIIKEETVAAQDVSFEVKPGQILSLIGESGSGKTTIGKLILKLLKPTEGSIYFKGQDITEIERKDQLKEYYRKVQGVFQDPFSSFNPLFKIDRVFEMVFREFMPQIDDKRERIEEVLESVNLNADNILGKYPHELSGGQLQRVLIARALLLDADILIADELISMLDASTRMGVLNLLVDICKQEGMSIIFITHDLNLGYYLSDYTLILYKGHLVERGETKKVYENPVHPYTEMLFNSVPSLDEKWDRNKEFLPEQINQIVEEFYKNNSKQGFEEVEEEHIVLFGKNN